MSLVLQRFSYKYTSPMLHTLVIMHLTLIVPEECIRGGWHRRPARFLFRVNETYLNFFPPCWRPGWLQDEINLCPEFRELSSTQHFMRSFVFTFHPHNCFEKTIPLVLAIRSAWQWHKLFTSVWATKMVKCHWWRGLQHQFTCSSCCSWGTWRLEMCASY